MGERVYIAIDLKSFYASVECVQRGLDPLTTNLVVADVSRTEKTICLAVSPSLKAHGIPGRARLFEVIERLREVNALRRLRAPGGKLTGESSDDAALRSDPALAVSYIAAPPQMALYMARSAEIYQIYLKYVAPEDIHVYSIDEVFMDVTAYLRTYRLTPKELAMKMIREVLEATGITATAGIGSNLYLCKVAMDIVAKRIPADENGMRIAQLDEMSYRRLLWAHRPLTDFWRVGRGYAKKLESKGLYTMGDIARCSLGQPGDYYNEDLLYGLFGVNAELLIDHAWGWEPCTMADIKAYRPESSSLSSGQVLSRPYSFHEGRLIVREMADQMALDLVDKGLAAGQLVLSVGYDVSCLPGYRGPVHTDHYGRPAPRSAHGSARLEAPTASAQAIVAAALALYDRAVDRTLTIRRVTLAANDVVPEDALSSPMEQLDLFADQAAQERERQVLDRERRRQRTILDIKRKFGKNAIFKGMDLLEGATALQRNGQIGGHRA